MTQCKHETRRTPQFVVVWADQRLLLEKMANLRITLAKLTLSGVEESDVEIGKGAYGFVKQCFYNGQKYVVISVARLLYMGMTEMK